MRGVFRLHATRKLRRVLERKGLGEWYTHPSVTALRRLDHGVTEGYMAWLLAYLREAPTEEEFTKAADIILDLHFAVRSLAASDVDKDAPPGPFFLQLDKNAEPTRKGLNTYVRVLRSVVEAKLARKYRGDRVIPDASAAKLKVHSDKVVETLNFHAASLLHGAGAQYEYLWCAGWSPNYAASYISERLSRFLVNVDGFKDKVDIGHYEDVPFGPGAVTITIRDAGPDGVLINANDGGNMYLGDKGYGLARVNRAIRLLKSMGLLAADESITKTTTRHINPADAPLYEVDVADPGSWSARGFDPEDAAAAIEAADVPTEARSSYESAIPYIAAHNDPSYTGDPRTYFTQVALRTSGIAPDDISELATYLQSNARFTSFVTAQAKDVPLDKKYEPEEELLNGLKEAVHGLDEPDDFIVWLSFYGGTNGASSLKGALPEISELAQRSSIQELVESGKGHELFYIDPRIALALMELSENDALHERTLRDAARQIATGQGPNVEKTASRVAQMKALLMTYETPYMRSLLTAPDAVFELWASLPSLEKKWQMAHFSPEVRWDKEKEARYRDYVENAVDIEDEDEGVYALSAVLNGVSVAAINMFVRSGLSKETDAMRAIADTVEGYSMDAADLLISVAVELDKNPDIVVSKMDTVNVREVSEDLIRMLFAVPHVLLQSWMTLDMLVAWYKYAGSFSLITQSPCADTYARAWSRRQDFDPEHFAAFLADAEEYRGVLMHQGFNPDTLNPNYLNERQSLEPHRRYLSLFFPADSAVCRFDYCDSAGWPNFKHTSLDNMKDGAQKATTLFELGYELETLQESVTAGFIDGYASISSGDFEGIMRIYTGAQDDRWEAVTPDGKRYSDFYMIMPWEVKEMTLQATQNGVDPEILKRDAVLQPPVRSLEQLTRSLKLRVKQLDTAATALNESEDTDSIAQSLFAFKQRITNSWLYSLLTERTVQGDAYLHEAASYFTEENWDMSDLLKEADYAIEDFNYARDDTLLHALIMARSVLLAWPNVLAGIRNIKPPQRPDTPIHTEDVETLYHATTKVTDLLTNGFRTDWEQGGGLGGSRSTKDRDVPGVSMTGDFYVAKEIVRCFREVVGIANGEYTATDVLRWGKDLNVPEEVILRNYDPFKERERAKSRGKEREYHQSPRHAAFQLYKNMMSHAHLTAHTRYDARFFQTSLDAFKGIPPEEIGVVKVVCDMTDPAIDYNSAEREYRVPVRAIKDVQPL